MKTNGLHILLWLLIIVTISACTSTNTIQHSTHVPKAPNYDDSAMWHIQINDIGKGADVFYIPSTWEFDWHTENGVISHYADPANTAHRNHMKSEMIRIAEYMADGNNFYSPYYRHITLDTWATLNEDTIQNRYMNISFVDIQNAFNYYLTHYNNGKPFILAGFSQGGKSVVELMKVLPAEVYSRMIAAYVLGYKVTPDDITAAPWIIPAQDSTDIGVTICYNSVQDVQYTKPIISTPNVMCINPVNWTTDATPAWLHDTICVTIAEKEKVLVLKGFDGSYLPNILDILNVGDYHGIEPWLYSECLRQNIKQRIVTYQQQNK